MDAETAAEVVDAARQRHESRVMGRVVSAILCAGPRLSYSDAKVLLYVAQAAPDGAWDVYPRSMLASHLQLSVSAVSRSLWRLKDRGWLLLRPHRHENQPHEVALSDYFLGKP